MSWFQRNRIRLLVAGLLFFSLLLFLAHMKERREQNWFDRALLWLTSPIQNAIVWTIDGVASTWKGYIYLVGVEEENQLLKKQLDQAKRGNARLAELETENQRLRALVNMQQVLGQEKIIAARVIGVNTSPVARTIRVNVGSSAGVKIGDAVVSGVGLVGRVSTVVTGYATVRLIVDGSSAVDAVIRRSRARGIVRGQGEDEACSLDYLVRTADVEVGDEVVTSGIGGVFSAGLKVGRIASVTSPSVGPFREAVLQPEVDFQTLEEVLVVTSNDEAPASQGESP
ncbi:MAG: rod shape-determining protein MreC [Deltaproteobacteria bacterium]|nr:rod shape-determining protein MreC [Deltaproteobacteria bacterium]